MSSSATVVVRHGWLDFIPKRGARVPAAPLVGLLALASVGLGGWGVASALVRDAEAGDDQIQEGIAAAIQSPALTAPPRSGPEILAAGSGTGVPEDGDAALADSDSDSEPEPEPEPEPAMPSSPRPEPEPLDPLSDTQMARAKRAASGLRTALGDGRVHTSRTLFSTVAETEGMQWETAQALCSALSIDGVGGWHLPSNKELRELRSARGLPLATYWSRSSSSRDPESAYVYDTGRRRSGLYLKMEPTASAVCVQFRPYHP